MLVTEVKAVDFRNNTESETNGTLQYNAYHSNNSNNVIRHQYIVRRLTPTECARLQGFPDEWGNIDHYDQFTDEQATFWERVRKTHAEINGKSYKLMKPNSLVNWYNKLHTDSAEYKMWGNGIALPCALYVMEGIAEVCKGGS